MNKKLLIIGVAVLLITVVGLSGCTTNNQTSNNNILPSNEVKVDGVKVTGDTNKIQITEYNLTKYQHLTFKKWYIDKSPGNYIGIFEVEVVYGSLNISDVDTNLSKRKYICENYLQPTLNFYPGWVWDSDYWEYRWDEYPTGYHYVISDFNLDAEISSWKVNGTAKNIGNDFLNYPEIVVNYYNSKGAWLASSSDSEDNIPSGYTWNFSASYSGEFRNDIDHISFEVKSNLYV